MITICGWFSRQFFALVTNGTVIYSHHALTPVIVAPGNPRVIPLEPEFITPQDGHDKQDCENAAAKRWVGEYGPQYRALGVTILGDDLYCKQPLCEAFLRQGLNFILVCKPDSHKTLYEWVAGLAATGDVQTLQTFLAARVMGTGVSHNRQVFFVIERDRPAQAEHYTFCGSCLITFFRRW